MASAVGGNGPACRGVSVVASVGRLAFLGMEKGFGSLCCLFWRGLGGFSFVMSRWR